MIYTCFASHLSMLLDEAKLLNISTKEAIRSLKKKKVNESHISSNQLYVYQMMSYASVNII